MRLRTSHCGWFALLALLLGGLLVDSAEATTSPSVNNEQQDPRTMILRQTALEHPVYYEAISGSLEEHAPHRQLAVEDIDIGEMFDKLVSTAPEQWTTGQWVFAAILLLLFLWCCGCLCGGRSYYNRGGGYYRSSGSGGSCFWNIVTCFCCYELCCRDCQDIPCCNVDGNAGSGEYFGGTMV